MGTHEGPSVLDLLRRGELLSCHLTRQGSNSTNLPEIALGGRYTLAIYKFRQGKWTLGDFLPATSTSCKREYAAYLLRHILHWDFIPLTVIWEGPRRNRLSPTLRGPLSEGNYYTITREEPSDCDTDQLRTICCFDLVANNTNHKPELVIWAPYGKLWVIDHGLTFHLDT